MSTKYSSASSSICNSSAVATISASAFSGFSATSSSSKNSETCSAISFSPPNFTHASSTLSSKIGINLGVTNSSASELAPGKISSVASSNEFPFPEPLKPFTFKRIPSKVLSENDYISNLTRLIEKDYFPHLPSLRILKELHEAEESSDSHRIAKAKRKLYELKKARLIAGQSPFSTGNTPMSSLHLVSSTPSSVNGEYGRIKTGYSELSDASKKSQRRCSTGSSSVGRNEGVEKCAYSSDRNIVQLVDGRISEIDPNLTVDDFQRLYTSEDNYSFEEIIKKEKTEKLASQRWIDQTAYDHNVRQFHLHALASVPRGSSNNVSASISNYSLNTDTRPLASTHRGNALLSNKMAARSALMFCPDGLPIEQHPSYLADKNKQIVSKNTRLSHAVKLASEQMKKQIIKMQLLEEEFDEEAERNKMVEEGVFKKGDGETSAVEEGSEGVNYPFVATPQIFPGVGPDKSPLMTWGKIANTPLLLQNMSTNDEYLAAIASVDEGGGRFRMPDLVPREKAAQKLQESASKRMKQKKKHMHENYRSLFCPLIRSSTDTSSSSRLRELAGKSPLVMKLVCQNSASYASSLSKCNIDTQLRDAYSGRRKSRMSTGLRTPMSISSPSATPNILNRTANVARSGMLTHRRCSENKEPKEQVFSLNTASISQSAAQSLRESERFDKPSVGEARDASELSSSLDVAYVQKHLYAMQKNEGASDRTNLSSSFLPVQKKRSRFRKDANEVQKESEKLKEATLTCDKNSITDNVENCRKDRKRRAEDSEQYFVETQKNNANTKEDQQTESLTDNLLHI